MPSVLSSEQQDHAPKIIKQLSYASQHPINNRRQSTETQPTPALDDVPGAWPKTPGALERSVLSVPDGANGAIDGRPASYKSSVLSAGSRRSSDLERKATENTQSPPRVGAAEEAYSTQIPNGKPNGPPRLPLAKPVATRGGDTPRHPPSATYMTPSSALAPVKEACPPQSTEPSPEKLQVPQHAPHHHRASSPPAFARTSASPGVPAERTISPPQARPDRLLHRHTLEVSKVLSSRTSSEYQSPPTAVVSATGRFSPTTPNRRRRGSLQLARLTTRSVHSHSDMHLDDVPQDDDAARWTEHIKMKRASKKQRTDTDDDRVVVGTKVDEHHVNWIMAYNMLTGIRFHVSRTNAKIDRELTDADFEAPSKSSFDIAGNELTPSAKYDFKFKDYAPLVFRHLRASFKLDPADYLISLTSKYILSELGSPGKSGSFFYFSRDYKYIIKTIHHSEHKFLRKILREYYHHVTSNPNTLLSQFYGLHRVKMPYGPKIHFVVMNNLFPPHRDIHRTFDLKGSTIGRDFKEEELEKNPRATLKDLNWLRRDLHLEFGPTKKSAFVEQIQQDVKLLQRLKIMDYSLLVGIHDLGRGNEENLRDKTLQVFQPGGEKPEEAQSAMLIRTPSKMESAKRAKELREMVKKEKPVPMASTLSKMPDVAEEKRGFYFYQDDGGFRATHEDDRPGEEIYYLGIIDCLTRYNIVKKLEHFWKGMGPHESQISPIPPERYGDRFVKFISGNTKTREAAEADRISQSLDQAVGNPHTIDGTIDDPRLSAVNVQKKDVNPVGTDAVMENAEKQADLSRQHGAMESDVPDRSMGTMQAHNNVVMLPIIGEAAENSSATSRTPSKVTPEPSHEDISISHNTAVLGNANMPAESLGEIPPPTPPKLSGDDDKRRESWGGGPPPTPPKDDRRGRFEKDLPILPMASKRISASPSQVLDYEMDAARRRAR